MSTNVTAEIQKIIAQNLPSATASELSKYIEEAEETKADLIEAQERVMVHSRTIQSQKEEQRALTEQVRKLNDILRAHDDLLVRENDVCIKERDLELTLTKIRLDAAEDRATALFSLVDKVFSVPSVSVKNTSDLVLQHGLSDGSTYQTTQPASGEKTTTERRE